MAHAESDDEWEVRVQTCRVDLWRGYLTANFTARLLDGPDAGSAVDASSSFRWRSSAPPDTEEARLAHYELLSRLKAAGWAPSGEGEEWFATELARPTLVPAQEDASAAAETGPPDVPAGEAVGVVTEPEPERAPRLQPAVAPEREPEPEPEPVPDDAPVVEPAAASRPRSRDRWRVAAILGLAIAIVYLVVLATHG